MEPIEQLSHILPRLNATVDRIQTMQMNDPTPCSQFTVHDVLNHIMVLGGSFAHLFRGEDVPEPKPHGVYGWVPAAEFRAVIDDLFGAIQSPGAMDRMITTPMGEMPGETFARLVAFDGLVHCWDLASSTGQTVEIPADVIEAVDQFARGALSLEMRDGDTFKCATTAPEGSSQLEQLVAFTGRAV